MAFTGDGEIYYEVCYTSYQPTMLMRYNIKGNKLRIDWANFDPSDSQNINIQDVQESAIMDFGLNKMWILEPQNQYYMESDIPASKEKGAALTFAERPTSLLISKTPVPVVEGKMKEGDISASLWLATEMGPFLGYAKPLAGLKNIPTDIQDQIHDGLFPVRMEFKNPKAHQYIYMNAMKIVAGSPDDKLFGDSRELQRTKDGKKCKTEEDRFFKSKVHFQ